jgi:hypothetical protein
MSMNGDDALNRIRELKDHTEALELALAEVRTATWEPKTTLPRVRHRIGQILLAVHNRLRSLPEPSPSSTRRLGRRQRT